MKPLNAFKISMVFFGSQFNVKEIPFMTPILTTIEWDIKKTH